MKRLAYILLLSGLLTNSCSNISNADSNQITVSNPSDAERTDAFFSIPIDELPADLAKADLSHLVVYRGEAPLPCQANDLDDDGQADELACVIDLAPAASETLTLNTTTDPPSFPSRTQAELSHKVDGYWEDREYMGGTFQNVEELHVPEEHTDHSYFIRYEGPGWESDRVGYRFYLDWRNATDIFGKQTTDLVLQDVGQDGFDSYHELAEWGMDVLKVGESLGLGSLGKWHNNRAGRIAMTDSLYCAVAYSGPVESMIRTNYYGWQTGVEKTDVTSSLSIHAGSRLTKHHVQLSTAVDSLCTGIVQLENTEVLRGSGDQWNYLATWGTQSLNDDQLGMAVIYCQADELAVTRDSMSHVVVLNPDDQELTYYFLAAWELEPNGITDRAAFEAYLEETLKRLDKPIEIAEID